MKALRQVTDRFSLFNDGRKLGANKRNYIVSSVQKMIESEATQEALRLGELFGYYGHQPRARANKISIGETEVITINGRPVVVENIPSNRMLSISCDDEGIVTHTQEILDTDTGRIVDSMQRSKAGGWSWATSGVDSLKASIANMIAGVDYVLKPNYLSLDHPAMMLESCERDQMMLESLQDHGGFDAESAQNIMTSMLVAPNNGLREAELETDVFFLEGVNAELTEQVNAAQEARGKLQTIMLEAVNHLPFYLTDEHKAALASMETEQDMKIVSAMFESLGSSKLMELPTNQFEPSYINQSKVPDEFKNNEVSFTQSKRFS